MTGHRTSYENFIKRLTRKSCGSLNAYRNSHVESRIDRHATLHRGKEAPLAPAYQADLIEPRSAVGLARVHFHVAVVRDLEVRDRHRLEAVSRRSSGIFGTGE